ncbi:hypothetical protein D9M73_151390 [compost metagenome]
MGRLGRPNLDDSQPVIQEPVATRDTPTKSPSNRASVGAEDIPGASETCDNRSDASLIIISLFQCFKDNHSKSCAIYSKVLT